MQSLAKSCSSSWLYASFDTFWVQIDLIRYEHWSFTCSMEFSKQNFVFSIFCSIFRDRFLLKYSVNLHSKGVKRSVKSWAKWFCKSHLENFYIWVRRIKALKIRSVQCYGMNRILFFGGCEGVKWQSKCFLKHHSSISNTLSRKWSVKSTKINCTNSKKVAKKIVSHVQDFLACPLICQ